MKKTLNPAERLIVAIDLEPGMLYPLPPGHNNCRKGMLSTILKLTNLLRRTGVYIGLGSALQALGYRLIDDIHDQGLKVLTDLNLFGSKDAMFAAGELLKESRPELLTVACTTGRSPMMALKSHLPNTEVLGVTVLTSLSETDTGEMFKSPMRESVVTLSCIGSESSLDGFISSPQEAAMLRRIHGEMLTINTPGILPTWAIVPGDDQNPDRIMTPQKAIQAGADRVVVGRPIMNAEDPYAAVMRTIDEIASATG